MTRRAQAAVELGALLMLAGAAAVVVARLSGRFAARASTLARTLRR